MATAEEIAANIARSQARKAAARERQKIANAKLVRAPHPHAAWEGKLVGFIVRTRKDMFKPIVARVSLFMDDHDGFLVPVAEQPSKEALEDARACFDGEGRNGVDHVFLDPIPSGGAMGSWLSQLLPAGSAH